MKNKYNMKSIDKRNEKNGNHIDNMKKNEGCIQKFRWPCKNTLVHIGIVFLWCLPYVQRIYCKLPLLVVRVVEQQRKLARRRRINKKRSAIMLIIEPQE